MTRVLILLAVTVATLCQAECKYFLPGDFDRDCRVDLDDLTLLASQWLVDCDSFPLSPACHCEVPWVPEPPMTVARDQFAGGVIDGKIYVFGGNGNPDGVNLKTLEMYDPATQEWTMLAQNPHNPHGNGGVEELTAAEVNGRLYVFGAWGGIGPGGDYGVFNFNEMYDPATDTWTTLEPKRTTCAMGAATVYNGEIYVFGGYYGSEASEDRVQYDVVECYNPTTDTWRFVTNMPQAISSFAVATVGTKAYLFGGVKRSEPDDVHLIDTVISYDFETKKWTTSGYESLPVKRYFMYSSSAPVIGGRVFLIGGGQETQDGFLLSKRVDVYDVASKSWRQATSLPLPLDDHMTLRLSNQIYVLGGNNNWDFTNGAKAEVISYDAAFCEAESSVYR